MAKPNVLLIMMDQLRFDALGYSSKKLVETPSLDWLASLGTVFTHAYTPSPSCIPARSCLMTGLKPWSTGVLSTGNSAGPHTPGSVMGVNFPHTLPGELVKSGYHAQGIGKMHFFPQRSLMGFCNTVLDESGREEDLHFCSDYKEWFLSHNPAHYGITDHGIHWNSWMARPFHAQECFHPSTWTVNQSLEYLDKRDPTIPFFLKVSFARPHAPYDPNQYFFDLYMNKKETLPKPFQSVWSEKYEAIGNVDSPVAWHGKRSEEEVERARAGYYGSITQTDHQIGRLLNTLAKAKLLDEMMIVFTSDHGDMLGDHNLWRKTYAYEGSSHIPLIIKLPKSMKKSGTSYCDGPVSLYDIMPTILDICGCPIPSDVEGESLLALLEGKLFQRMYVTGEHTPTYSGEEDHYFITDGKCKYIWFLKTGKEMLFDLEVDPQESINLVANTEYKELLQRLRNHVKEDLAKRNSEAITFVEHDRLVPLGMNATIISPHYLERLNTSPYAWM